MTESDFLAQINAHQGIIHKLLNLYVDDADEKEDMYQEVLLQAWKAKDRFRGDSLFSTWLYKVCLHTVLAALRKSKRMTKVSFDTSRIEEADENSADKKDKQTVLYLAIKQLAEIERTMIVMHLDGFSNLEIADFVGITANNANVRLHRIKEKLTKIIQGG